MPFLLTALLVHCGSAPVSRQTVRQDDPEKESLRQRLAESQVRILKLELDKARLQAKSDEELKILIEALASEFSEVRAAALLELGALPEERRKAAVPEVLKRFPSAPEPFKVQAIAFLGRIPSPEADDAVLTAASDASPNVRIAAASALKASGRTEAIQTLMALLADPSRQVRMAALDALGVAKREMAVEAILKLISDEKDEDLLEKAADALGAIGSAAAVGPLLDLLKKPIRESVRWSCINSLGKIGDSGAAESLRPYLEPPHTPAVREVAIEALGKMKDAASTRSLLQILRAEREEKLRIKAATALGRIVPQGEIENLLLPAYADEKSQEVRRTLWESMKFLAGDAFEPNERLIAALLKRKMRSEAEEICTRLHSAKPDDKLLSRYIATEESVAQAALEAGDTRAALVHYRQALSLAPDRAELRRKVAACYRELNDLDSAVKTLREIEPKLPRGEAAWWANKMDILGILKLRADSEALAVEAHGLLSSNPVPLPEEYRKPVEQAFRQAALKLIQPLAEKDEAARRAGQETVRRLGKTLASWLAAEIESAAGPAHAPIFEAAGAILGAPPDPSKPKETSAALRAWLAQQQ